jgi:putative endonuclease
MITVYILFSDSCSKFYTGQTADLVNRLLEHNSGETRSIRSCMPWRLIWTVEQSSRSDAMNLESKIKKRGAVRFLTDNNITF